MVVFLIPLKSRQVALDWPRVCMLLHGTLRSIFNQTDGDFRVIVIAHEKPELPEPFDDRLEILSVDIPVPTERHDTARAMNDKWLKLRYGLVRAAALAPDHLMIVDADDRVSRRLVEHTKRHPHPNGWIITSGYKWPYGSRWAIYDGRTFNCGTNAILNTARVRLPRDVSDEEARDCVMLSAGHTIIARTLRDNGTPLATLPFPGSLYISDHGDNDSHLGRANQWLGWRHWLRLLPLWRPVTAGLRREFALETEPVA